MPPGPKPFPTKTFDICPDPRTLLGDSFICYEVLLKMFCNLPGNSQGLLLQVSPEIIHSQGWRTDLTPIPSHSLSPYSRNPKVFTPNLRPLLDLLGSSYRTEIPTNRTCVDFFQEDLGPHTLNPKSYISLHFMFHVFFLVLCFWALCACNILYTKFPRPFWLKRWHRIGNVPLEWCSNRGSWL